MESVDIVPGSPPILHLKFSAAAGQTYTVQYTGSDPSKTWLKLSDVPAQGSTQIIDITDPMGLGNSQRFYRIITPAQP